MAAHVATAVPAVQKIIEMMSSLPSPRYCEFELRLGQHKAGDDSFVSGVDAAFIGALLCKLETSSVWSETTPWTQIVDRFFLLPSGLQVCSSSQMARGEDPDTESRRLLRKEGTQLKLEEDDSESHVTGGGGASAGVDEEKDISASEDEGDDDYTVTGGSSDDDDGPEDDTRRRHEHAGLPFYYETSHVIKTGISHVDLRWTAADGVPDILRSREGFLYDMRVGLKQEMPLFEDELQECAEETNTVRIKQRRSFKYTPVGKDRVRWAIDITQVWQGASYTSALECLRNGNEPKYEVEIECLDPYEFLKEMNNDTRRLSLSLLLKAADLFSITSQMQCRLCPALNTR